MTLKQRLNLEKCILAAIKSIFKLTEFEGTYYSLQDLNQGQKKNLMAKHVLFKEGDRFLQSAGINDDWPHGRGTYISKDAKFSIWINEEDHLRIMYFDKNPDISLVGRKLFKAVDLLHNKLNFAYHQKLGYLNSCPTNIGTAMRASILIKLQHYSESVLKEKCSALGLGVRGTFGEHTKAVDSAYDISFRKRLGDSERSIINDLVKSVNALSM